MFELYKNELTTPEAIRSKLEEIEKQYNNYLKLSKQYNWKASTVNKNKYIYQKTIESFEKALQEVTA